MDLITGKFKLMILCLHEALIYPESAAKLTRAARAELSISRDSGQVDEDSISDDVMRMGVPCKLHSVQ